MDRLIATAPIARDWKGSVPYQMARARRHQPRLSDPHRCGRSVSFSAVRCARRLQTEIRAIGFDELARWFTRAGADIRVPGSSTVATTGGSNT